MSGRHAVGGCSTCRHSTRSMMRSMARMLRDTTFHGQAGRELCEIHSCKPLPAVVAVAIHRVFAPMALHDAAQVGTLQAFACDHLSLSLV